VGEIIKRLQPSPSLIELTKRLFKDIWAMRLAQAQDAIQSAKNQMAQVYKQLETLLSRLIETNSSAVIRAYEQKIEGLETKRARLEDQMTNMTPPEERSEEMLELSLKFLANPWKIWENGQIGLND